MQVCKWMILQSIIEHPSDLIDYIPVDYGCLSKYDTLKVNFKGYTLNRSCL
jgi:hypothetical protein